MKKLRYIALATLMLMGVSSCNKWLDITPTGQVEASKILTDEKGFNYASAGVYSLLGGSSMYGKALQYGQMDVLAQYYDFSTLTLHDYKSISEYDFEDTESVNFFNTIWSTYYEAIAQNNLILQSIDLNGAQIANSELFEGEAYGLRAFMHFELLKYFAPAIRNSSDLDKKAIPYRKNFDVVALEFNTIQETIDLIEADLLKALELLANDPIKIYGREGDANENQLEYTNVLKRRGTRMNYYATLGLLARLKMWEGDKSGALVYAERLINEADGVINLTQTFGEASELIRDIVCQSEFLFAIYNDNMYDLAGANWGFGDYTVSAEESLIFSETYHLSTITSLYTNLPDGSGRDYRFIRWFVAPLGSSDYQFTKLAEPVESVAVPPVPYWPELPVMKLSEIYYIACEALIGVDNTKAVEYLEAVRETRGLDLIVGTFDDATLMDYLEREMRKDFYGEGIMYSFYKRTLRPIDIGSGKIPVSESMYLFPIPDSEYEFSPNEKK